MAQFPAMPLWTDAYLADTVHLTTLEHGAYLMLLISMWRADGTLPDDDKRLARCARLGPGQWKRIRPTLMEFFVVQDGQVTQPRLTDELTAVRQKSRKQSNNAKARWLKTKKTDDATASGSHSHGNASLTHIPESSLRSDSEEVARTETEPPPVAQGAGRATPHLIPDDWVPNTTNQDWLADSGMSVHERKAVVDEFVRWAKNAGRRQANWDLAFSRNSVVKGAVGRARSRIQGQTQGSRLGMARPAPADAFAKTDEELAQDQKIVSRW